jgi:hypothetical protein
VELKNASNVVILTINNKKMLVHVDRLKPYHSPDDNNPVLRAAIPFNPNDQIQTNNSNSNKAVVNDPINQTPLDLNHQPQITPPQTQKRGRPTSAEAAAKLLPPDKLITPPNNDRYPLRSRMPHVNKISNRTYLYTFPKSWSQQMIKNFMTTGDIYEFADYTAHNSSSVQTESAQYQLPPPANNNHYPPLIPQPTHPAVHIPQQNLQHTIPDFVPVHTPHPNNVQLTQPSPAFAMTQQPTPLMDHQLPFLNLQPAPQNYPLMDDSDNNLVIHDSPFQNVHLQPPTPLRPLTPPPIEQPMDNSLLPHTFYADDSSHPLVIRNYMSRPQPYCTERTRRPTPERPLPSPQPIVTYPPSPTEPSPLALQFNPPSPIPQTSQNVTSQQALQQTHPIHELETNFRAPLPIDTSRRPTHQIEFDPRLRLEYQHTPTPRRRTIRFELPSSSEDTPPPSPRPRRRYK